MENGFESIQHCVFAANFMAVEDFFFFFFSMNIFEMENNTILLRVTYIAVELRWAKGEVK